jgi:hypothetical protein
MNDLADDAHQAEESHRESSLNLARKQKEVKFTGFCLNCNNKLIEGRFCPGGECREDYELNLRIGKIKGK